MYSNEELHTAIAAIEQTIQDVQGVKKRIENAENELGDVKNDVNYRILFLKSIRDDLEYQYYK